MQPRILDCDSVDLGEVLGCGDLSRLIEAVGRLGHRAGRPYPLCLGVHRVDRALVAVRISQRDRGVVPAAHQHPVEQLVHRVGVPGEHPDVGAFSQRLLRLGLVHAVVLQPGQQGQRREGLDRGRHRPLPVVVLPRQDVPGLGIHEDPRFRREVGHRHALGSRGSGRRDDVLGGSGGRCQQQERGGGNQPKQGTHQGQRTVGPGG